MSHTRDKRNGCLGCVGVLALLTSIFVCCLFFFGPPLISNVIEALARRAVSSATTIRDRLAGAQADREAEQQLQERYRYLGYAGRLLPERQWDIYVQLYEGVTSLADNFAVFECAADDVDPTYKALMRDHPELFWVDGSCSYTYSAIGNVVTVTPRLTMPTSEVESTRAQIEAVTDAFLSTVAGASEYDIAKAAYEYVISTTDYSVDAVHNQNIVSVLLNHSSVCAGYARTYQYLLQRAGMFCTYVEGRITDRDEDHAWNLVSIDGAYTYVDPTWGDPAYLGDSPHIDSSGIIYDYFCLTTDEISRDHAFANPDIWPACNSTELDYYVRRGLLFDSYDETALSTSFREQTASGERMCAFKFTNDEALAQARAEIEAGTFLWNDLPNHTTSYSYTISDSLRILKVFW